MIEKIPEVHETSTTSSVFVQQFPGFMTKIQCDMCFGFEANYREYLLVGSDKAFTRRHCKDCSVKFMEQTRQDALRRRKEE